MARLTFLGGAGTVTGSCYLLETEKLKLLVDCGMFQGNRELRMRNYRNLDVPTSSIDYILLTHAHIDHSGLIPRVHKQGFRGKVITTNATVDLCGIMLPDSGHIHEIEAEWEARKAQRRGEKQIDPLYTAQDALNCLQSFTGISYGQEIPLDDQVRIRFLDAGHILGSAFIEVWIKENGQEVKIVFSGDLGNKNTPIIRDPAWVSEADYLLLESTYGDRLHEPVANESQKLQEIILDTFKRKGNVIIPSFAVGRTQELLFRLSEMFKRGELPPVPVYIDSPLAVSATEIFAKNPDYYDEEAIASLRAGVDPFHFPNLTFVRDAKESIALNNNEHQSKVIISSSGMCDAGRIKHHLKHNLWRQESSVVFVGYQAEGTLGRRILDGEKKIHILGELISVTARIYSLQGFSAHADQNGLLEWASHLTGKPERLFVVHGEAAASSTLGTLLEQRLGFSTVIPRAGEQYLLTPCGLQLVKTPPPRLHPASLDTRQQLLLDIFRLEKKLAEAKEDLLLMENGDVETESLKQLVPELSEKINALLHLAPTRG